MALATEKGERYLADYEALRDKSSRDGTAWVQPIRDQAWARFSALGFPTARRGNERWKYTNLRPLAQATFLYPPDGAAGLPGADEVKRRAPWDDSWTTLVFVDGHYSEQLSTRSTEAGGIVAGNLATAITDHRDLVEGHLAKHARFDDEAFTALNTAFLDEGAFVHIPDGVEPAAPVQLLFITTDGEQARVAHPRVLVIAGKSSKATLIESYVSLGDGPGFTNTVVEAVLSEGASVRHYRILMENENTFHIGNTRVYQSNDSKFTSTSFATGPSIGRNDVHVLLDAPGAECTLHGLYMTTNRQHMDNHINVTHAKPHGTSRQFYKGILSGESRATFSGLVLVERDAQKSFADQKDLNLVLSEGAEVDTKPSLEIYADDIQAFHGATAGHVNQDTLFYLQSRGIDRETALAMLIGGFASEIVDEIEVDSLRTYVEDVTSLLIPGFQPAGKFGTL
ncbi:MAG: Fe-S cluster assembly protein SufD [Dehalococcoidia bacterium]